MKLTALVQSVQTLWLRQSRCQDPSSYSVKSPRSGAEGTGRGERAAAQHLEHDTCEFSGKAADRPALRPALGPLPCEACLRPVVTAALDQGHRVEGTVELTIAAAVGPHPFGLARACRDRRRTREHGERIGRAEAASVAGLGEDPRREEGASARQREERVTD